MEAQTNEIKIYFDGLFNEIKHGDKEHQQWLYDQMQEYLKSHPIKEFKASASPTYTKSEMNLLIGKE